MSRSRLRCLVAIVVLLVAMLAGFALAHAVLRPLLLAYLATWLLASGAVLGSACLLLIHALTGGEWGVRLMRAWLAAIRFFPWLVVFFIPLLAGALVLLPWLSGSAPDAYLAQQRWYLNGTGLIIRTTFNLLIWWWLLRAIDRALQRQRLTAGKAAGALIVLFVTLSIEAIDWIMSLVPRWHSTDIGLLLFTSDIVVAFALAIITTFGTATQSSGGRWIRDVGNLLLVAVLGWAYVSFMDYLTAWIADQPDELAWYLPRLDTGWWYVAIALIVCGLAVPFFVLLQRHAKQSVSLVRGVAWLVLFAQWLNLVWLVLPGASAAPLPWLGCLLVCGGLLGFCGLCYWRLLPARVHP